MNSNLNQPLTTERQMKEIKNLEKGDKINIEFGRDIEKAIVVANDSGSGKIVLKVGKSWFGAYGWICTKVFDYKDYYFHNYKLLNS